MNWKFFINEIEIAEPVGFADIAINIKRDENWKGIFFEASTSALRFYGDAFDILKDLKEDLGLKAVAIFKAQNQCEGDVTYEDAITGKLNFGQYRETCGNECFISMPVEQDNCTMILRNRYDQKVNIDDPKSYNKVTDLPAYAGLGKVFSLPTFEMPIAVKGTVGTETVDDFFLDDFPVGGFTGGVAGFAFRPTFYNQIENSIKTGELLPGANVSVFNLGGDEIISPYLLFEETVLCTDGVMNYNFRIKGNYSASVNGAGYISQSFIRVYKFDGINKVTIHNVVLLAAGGTPPSDARSFDQTFTGSITLNEGESIGVMLVIAGGGFNSSTTVDVAVTFDPESSVDITMTRNCPPSPTFGYFINETAARIAESITDLCITVNSDYYGRIDSQPFSKSIDGCGSLRFLTNGLKIRLAEKNNDFFLSLKELFDGLNAIDNIGIGIEDDPLFPATEKRLLRIEPAEYFFQNVEIMKCDFIPAATKEINEQKIYAKILIGYDKYESGSVKGTDEFNSQKEFRTSIDATDTTLNQVCKFIAGTYPIEVTRQQGFVNTGEADTKYDNDTFIICVMRTPSAIVVEQGNIDNATNLLSFDTLYNWRIRPFYNLMRWAKSIFQSYANIFDADSLLFFSSGKGNYTASGELPAGDPCKLENGAKAENKDLSINDFADQSKGQPIVKAENISFDYPMSIAEYRKIKQNPYGYISVQCGLNSFVKAYINQIDYRVAEGLATFNLVFKWD